MPTNNNNEKTPFYLDKKIWATAVIFTIFGYYGVDKIVNWYKNRNANI